MVSSEREPLNWSTLGAIAGILAFLITLFVTLWEYLPDEWRIPVSLAALAAVIVIGLSFTFNVSVRALVNSYARAISVVCIGLLIPLSHILILGYSPQLLVVTLIELGCIVLMISLSREWRTAKVVRSRIADDEPFSFLGFIDDEVGRGPHRDNADGAVDATFRLRLQEDGKVVSRIRLSQMKGRGSEPTHNVWDSGGHHLYWVLGVLVDGTRARPNRYGHLNITVSRDTELLLFASDSWWRSSWFAAGKRYEVEVLYKSSDEPKIYDVTIK